MNTRALIFADGKSREQLQAEIAEINEHMQSIRATADTEQRDLSDDERAAVDQLFSRFQIASAALESAPSQWGKRQVRGEAPEPTSVERRAARAWGTAPQERVHAPQPRRILAHVPGARMVDVRGLFFADARPERHPFTGLAPLAAAVWNSAHAGVIDPRLSVLAATPATSGTSSDPASGGFAVPRVVEMLLLDDIFGASDILNLCDTRPLMSGMHSYPTFDGQDRSDGGIGGLTTEWTSETGAFTAQKPDLREVELQPKKLGTLVALSNELLADARNFESQLRDALVANARRALEEVVIRGAGGTQPLGILNAASTIAITRTASRYADLLSLYAKNFNRSRSVWLVHSTVIPELFTLNFEGDGATTDLAAPVFSVSPSGDMQLLGRPVLVHDGCGAATALGDVIFVDLQSYILGMRSGLTIQASGHIYFDADAMAIRAIQRADGAPKYSTTITQRDGSTLNSWAVTIAA